MYPLLRYSLFYKQGPPPGHVKNDVPEQVLVEDHLLGRPRGWVVEGHLLSVGHQPLMSVSEGAREPGLLGGHEGEWWGHGPQHKGRCNVVPVQ